MPAETPTPLPACPFCGGENIGYVSLSWTESVPRCNSCLATAPSAAAWSRRVTPDAGVREALEKLREWLNDPKLNGWSYMESSAFYMDKAEHLARIDAALASTPPQVKTEAGAWRTMESAPRDGQMILLATTRSVFEGGWWEGDWVEAGADQSLRQPTHWQPLPTPPQVTP